MMDLQWAYNWVRSRLPNYMVGVFDPADIVQEALIRFFDYGYKVDNIRHFNALFKRVLLSVFHDNRRRALRRSNVDYLEDIGSNTIEGLRIDPVSYSMLVSELAHDAPFPLDRVLVRLKDEQLKIRVKRRGVETLNQLLCRIAGVQEKDFPDLDSQLEDYIKGKQ